MKSDPGLDDLRWLISAAAEEPLAEAGAESGDLLRLAQRLRKTFSPERAHLLIEQASLRQRARGKFAAAERMFFTPIGLQQATDEFVARYKARRFPAGPVADLCCGIGGDLLALGNGREAVGLDRNAGVALFARANCEAVHKTDSPLVVSGNADRFAIQDFAAWHIDPDRRPSGGRKTRVELSEPGSEVIDRLLADNINGAIKLAPAAEVPEGWADEAQQEWISRDGECKQLVTWFGLLAHKPGTRQATVLDVAGNVLSSIVGRQSALAGTACTVQQYVYEADSAVLAAGLVGTLCEQHNLLPLIPGGGYLTSDRQVNDPALTGFRVEAVLPYRTDKVKALLADRSIGRLEVKKRGVELEPGKVQRELKVEGDEHSTLLITRAGDKVIAILAQRI